MVGETAVEDEEEIQGVVNCTSVPWVVGGVSEVSKCEYGCRNPKRIDVEYQREEVREKMPRTLDAWMPKKVELKNKYHVFQIEAEGEEEVEEISAVKAEEENGVVRVTVDSGAAKSVWPRKKKGVMRRELKNKPRLAAANGTRIEVYGEAVLEFERAGRQCGMRFLDSDVRKPLAAVSAMNDEGNTVVFSKKWGNYVENDETKERIEMERVGDTFEMVLKTRKREEGTKREVKWAEDGGKKFGGMEVDANEEEKGDEEMEEEVGRGRKGEVVFRRRMLTK
jgi:hypothetical protein